jgi:hypothetical protein
LRHAERIDDKLNEIGGVPDCRRRMHREVVSASQRAGGDI